MPESSEIVPLRGEVLVKKVPGEGEKGGIIIPQQYGSLSAGVVLALSEHASTAELSVGDTVLFPDDLEMRHVGENRYLIPVTTLLAAVPSDTPADERGRSGFFQLPSWEEFRRDDKSYKQWKDWQRISRFEFRIRFLEPFRSLEAVGRRLYEHFVQELTPHLPDNFDAFKFEVLESRRNGLQDESVYGVVCQDDYWHGALLINGKERYLEFHQKKTEVRQLLETAPVFMRAIERLLRDPVLTPIAGFGHDRVTLVALRIDQIIRLEGQGVRNAPVRNSESMGHFLRFGLSKEEKGISPALNQLGLGTALDKTIGRVDLDISYSRKINKKPYRVWFNPRAPGNEDSSQIHIRWEIQDPYPGDLLGSAYGDVITYFFRDVVLKGLYQTWFDEIRCTAI